MWCLDAELMHIIGAPRGPGFTREALAPYLFLPVSVLALLDCRTCLLMPSSIP
jgi:hypothetical protein